MLVAIILGMGMPTTAAYAVAAAVIAPGLIQMGIAPADGAFLHLLLCRSSAPSRPLWRWPAYAGAAIAQSDPMRTSVESFKFGLAAFIVPFMFFYSTEMLMQGEWLDIIHVFLTALFGIYLMASAFRAGCSARSARCCGCLPLRARWE
jgi:TRAP-type uncharacterized transport system fused permease subunit